MREKEISLGQALAHLLFQSNLGDLKKPSKLSKASKEYVNQLLELSTKIQSEGRISSILNATFEKCDGQNACLEQDEDFWVALILNQQQKNNSKKDRSFFEHLNNCFICFEAFRPVIRDYYFEANELAKIVSGVNHVFKS